MNIIIDRDVNDYLLHNLSLT